MEYESILSRRACELKPSGIRKFFDLLEERKDVIALTVGQPDFVTPWHIREAGVESLEKGKTYYTSNAGTLELRQAIAEYLARRFSVEYDPKTEVIVTVGGSEAIDLAIRALTNPGDEIIIPEPCFVCYEPLVKLADGVPVIVQTEEKDKFKLTPEKLKAALTPRTKAVVLPFPANPTGAILTKEDLSGLADVLRDTGVMVIADEIYGELTYGRRHVSIASLDGMRERTVLCSGFSKAYAMTGWRMGYVCAPAPVAKQMVKIHQFAIMCAPTTSQLAAIEAMKNGDDDIAMMRAEYNRRRTHLVERLHAMGIPCFEPEGAFYVFPNISCFGMTSDAFCEKLMMEYKVAIVPGSAFGACGEGFARISYAYSMEHIDEALDRMEAMIRDLRKN